ncbi:MAG: ApaG domain, partial [Klebsiella sp.]|nr:ApaG domain [Klebsiella sp.]
HGVFGYSRWKNDEFLAAIAHWFSTQHYTAIDPQSVVYGPSVIYMVSELIRQWSETGEGVVIHTPAYDAFYKAIEGNQRTVMPVALEKQADGWFCDMGKLEAVLAKPECKIMLLCSPQNPTGKVWTCDELEIMADLCERHGVRVISDEIHMDMVWGEQPHIPAGGEYQYTSGAVIETPLGTMQGHYEMIDVNGAPFSIEVPVFRLAVPTLIH